MARTERVILIVDDSPEDREGVRRYLRKDQDHDYRFLEGSTGQEGLLVCQTQPLDCLLLDYNLPDMDGIQFLTTLRNDTERLPVPVVMLTGRGGETVAVQALKQGIQDYLIKGMFTPEVIHRTVNDAIERVAMSRQLEAQRLEVQRLYDEARVSDRRKDEFLAMLAHELRNPLVPILNAVHVMKHQPDDPALIERMRLMIERQTGHLGRLVEDLLDVSRITRGKIELRPERIDLASIVNVAVENTRGSIDRRRQQLAVSLPTEPVPLNADPTRIEQVLVNLLGNASKYTDPGGFITLVVRQDENQVVISVADTGIGIDPKMLPQVFDLFAQADHSPNRAQGGLGIGLTLVKNLVELHEGQVEARSPGLGQGSEFIVRLPRPSPLDRVESAPRAHEKTTSGPSFSILIVDDNTHAADTLELVVKLWGHDPLVAYNGPDALAMARKFRPRILLLDIGLPGMDGYAVARSLRASDDLKGVYLVAMTGYGRDEDMDQSTAAGFDRHMVKPIDLGELQSMIEGLNLDF